MSRADFQQIKARELLCYMQNPNPETGHLGTVSHQVPPDSPQLSGAVLGKGAAAFLVTRVFQDEEFSVLDPVPTRRGACHAMPQGPGQWPHGGGLAI